MKIFDKDDYKKKSIYAKKNLAPNPLRKGINESCSYLEHVRKAFKSNPSMYKDDLERAERKAETNCQRRYIA